MKRLKWIEIFAASAGITVGVLYFVLEGMSMIAYLAIGLFFVLVLGVVDICLRRKTKAGGHSGSDQNRRVGEEEE